MKRKTFPIEVREATADGGRIVISTPTVDRDKDRVMPFGARVESYNANAVVQWGHNYRDPWATVGRTTKLEITDDGIVADFELRPPANDSDPQNIVRLLWDGGWVRTASIGFNPLQWEENEAGGIDFTEWELLEWSLVPIPANQEALRLAAKALGTPANYVPTLEIWTPDDDGTVTISGADDDGVIYRGMGFRIVADDDEQDEQDEGSSEAAEQRGVDDDTADTGEADGQSKDQGASDGVPDEAEQPDGSTDADDGLTPEQEAALVEALDNFLSTITEVIGQ